MSPTSRPYLVIPKREKTRLREALSLVAFRNASGVKLRGGLSFFYKSNLASPSMDIDGGDWFNWFIAFNYDAAFSIAWRIVGFGWDWSTGLG